MTTGINEMKTLTKHLWCDVNVNLTVENAIQIKIGITINVVVIVKIQKRIVCEKKL